jgi:hypothetical protein
LANIKQTKVAGLEALEFETSNVSSGARHTIFTYKNQAQVIILFDIYKTTTGLSVGSQDTTSAAYNLMRQTFQVKGD